jgi:drug/metabolite transporter (DMT)-like permease
LIEWLKAVSKKTNEQQLRGINSALLSAFFLGMAPIFGKKAISLGLDPLAVVAFRTFFASILLFTFILIFKRKYLYIYPVGLAGCMLAGLINGLGSLFYYEALQHIGAGIGQFLYLLYPFFVALWMMFDYQKPSRLTSIRLIIALPAVFLLVQLNGDPVKIIGVIEMIIASALYALHLPINQRVLLEMPAPTVTLYTLLAMSAIVVPPYLFSGNIGVFPEQTSFWWPLVGLTLVTLLSRVTLFLGVKNLGGMQTAILGLSELLVTVTLAHLWLKESLSIVQWVGASLLMLSLLLVGLEKPPPQINRQGGWFSWLSPPPTIPPDLDFRKGP